MAAATPVFRVTRAVLAVAAATFLVGCADRVRGAPPPEIAGFIPQFEPGPCANAAMGAPRPGDHFAFDMNDAKGAATGRWVDRVQRVRGDLVDTGATYQPKGLAPREAPSESLLGGVIVASQSAPGVDRAYAYPAEAMVQVRALTPGAKVSLPTAETSKIRGTRKLIHGTTEVALKACGAVTVNGRVEPVRVFDVLDFRRTVLMRQGRRIDEARPHRIRVYVSDRLGWRLATQSQAGRLVAVAIPS